jgi:hypothetical protein
MRPPPPLPLSFGFPAQQPLSPSPISLSPWCPRAWRRRSPEFGSRGELPSLPFSSLSPSPSSLPLRAPPLLSPARACPCAAARHPAPPLPFPVRRGRDPSPPVPGGARPAPPLPGGARPRPSPSPSGAAPPLPSPAVLGPPLLPGPPARPCAGAARRGRVPARAQPLRGRGSARAQPMRGARPRPPATRLRPLRAAVLAPLRGVRPSD